MSNKIELKEVKEQPVLSIRKTTPMKNLQQELGQAYQALFQYLGQLGEAPADAPFAGYFNMDMEALDVEMGVPVTKPLAGKGEIKAGSIPAGRQVHCLYKGSYSQLEAVYADINKWMNENGCAPTGVVYEFYLKSPADVPENELETRIVFPVK
jgi:effector-binding domain-containing protein